MDRKRIPMNIQFFAEPAPAGGEGGTSNGSAGTGTQPPAIDYTKIQQMLDTTLSAREDTALKDYFKKQGLSQEEAEQSMAAFKAEKAKNQPDVQAMQNQVTEAQNIARKAQLQSAATMAAVELGLDIKTIPYVLKMADMSQVVDKDGKINEETLKSALNKVLEDVPGLKPQAAGSTGFVQVGAGGNTSQQTQKGTQTQQSVASKRWNRWN